MHTIVNTWVYFGGYKVYFGFCSSDVRLAINQNLQTNIRLTLRFITELITCCINKQYLPNDLSKGFLFGTKGKRNRFFALDGTQIHSTNIVRKIWRRTIQCQTLRSENYITKRSVTKGINTMNSLNTFGFVFKMILYAIWNMSTFNSQIWIPNFLKQNFSIFKTHKNYKKN